MLKEALQREEYIDHIYRTIEYIDQKLRSTFEERRILEKKPMKVK